ncbi:hypothetical protein U1Q18_049937, partial [Sarracenia purpurea var. burkii]
VGFQLVKMTTRSKSLRLKEGLSRVEELNREKGTMSMVGFPSLSSSLEVEKGSKQGEVEKRSVRETPVASDRAISGVSFPNQTQTTTVKDLTERSKSLSPSPVERGVVSNQPIGKGQRSPARLSEVFEKAAQVECNLGEDEQFQVDQKREAADERERNLWKLKMATHDQSIAAQTIKNLKEVLAIEEEDRNMSEDEGNTYPEFLSDIPRGGGRTGFGNRGGRFGAEEGDLVLIMEAGRKRVS